MVEIKTTEIGGKTFAVPQMGARRGITLQAKLIRVIGPAISSLAVSGSGASLDVAFIGAALSAIGDKLSDADFTALMRDIMYGVKVNGVSLDYDGSGDNSFDAVFMAKYADLIALIKFIVVDVNHFFGAGSVPAQAGAREGA